MRSSEEVRGLLSKKSGGLGAAFSATLPSSSNDLMLGGGMCAEAMRAKGIHLENY